MRIKRTKDWLKDNNTYVDICEVAYHIEQFVQLRLCNQLGLVYFVRKEIKKEIDSLDINSF